MQNSTQNEICSNGGGFAHARCGVPCIEETFPSGVVPLQKPRFGFSWLVSVPSAIVLLLLYLKWDRSS